MNEMLKKLVIAYSIEIFDERNVYVEETCDSRKLRVLSIWIFQNESFRKFHFNIAVEEEKLEKLRNYSSIRT